MKIIYLKMVKIMKMLKIMKMKKIMLNIKKNLLQNLIKQIVNLL